MFRSVARVSLRRGLHTAAPHTAAGHASRRRLAVAVGGSAAAAAYLTWRLSSETQKIALDSGISPKQSPQPGKSSLTDQSPEPLSTPEAPPIEPTLSEKDVGGNSTSPEGEGEDEEGSAQGAFDPVTGKINWDCPCLGGMAHGPCGMQFRDAFSCFVFSEEEPKGIDCVEKFKAMQDCFRDHPDVYGDEIMNDDEEEEEGTTTPSSPPEKKVDPAIAEGVALEAATSTPTDP